MTEDRRKPGPADAGDDDEPAAEEGPATEVAPSDASPDLGAGRPRPSTAEPRRGDAPDIEAATDRPPAPVPGPGPNGPPDEDRDPHAPPGPAAQAGGADRADRAELAGRVMAHYLRGNPLPGFIPGEPRGLIAALTATHLARRILQALERIYSIDRSGWDAERFERDVLGTALPMWRPDAEVRRDGDDLVVVSPSCPFLEETRKDPRVCTLCRRTLEAMGRQALDRPGLEVRADALITRGAPECVVRIGPLPATTDPVSPGPSQR